MSAETEKEKANRPTPASPAPRSIDQFRVGDEHRERRLVSDEAVRGFAEVSGDKNRIHLGRATQLLSRIKRLCNAVLFRRSTRFFQIAPAERCYPAVPGQLKTRHQAPHRMQTKPQNSVADHWD